MAIQNENEFRSFLSGRIAERSISSYVSNLNAASSVLHCDISHSTLSCELHISNLCSRLADAGMPAHRIRDTRSAMKKYLEMVTYIPSEEVSQIDHRHDEPEEVADDSRHSVNSTFREKLLSICLSLNFLNVHGVMVHVMWRLPNQRSIIEVMTSLLNHGVF